MAQPTTDGDGATDGVRQRDVEGVSPGINDPTTARDAILHLGTLLVPRLASARPELAYRGQDGRRLLTPHPFTDAALAEPAGGELRRAATGEPTVCIYVYETVADIREALAGHGRDAEFVHRRP